MQFGAVLQTNPPASRTVHLAKLAEQQLAGTGAHRETPARERNRPDPRVGDERRAPLQMATRVVDAFQARPMQCI